MIDALARPTATLRSKLLRHIPAPQTTSGFAEVRHKTITYRVVKCECYNLWQEHLRSGNAPQKLASKGSRRPSESELVFTLGENQSDLLPHL